MKKSHGALCASLLIVVSCKKIERRVSEYRMRASKADLSAQVELDKLPPTGCSLPQPRPAMVTLEAVDGRGLRRKFDVLPPSSLSPRAEMALTFVFHAAGGTAKSAEAMGLQNVPGASNSIFVFPEGIEYEQGKGWDDACSGSDMVFFDRMLVIIRNRFCVDPKRVFAAGFSWGADFVTALLCCRGDLLRAAAPASCSDEFSNPANPKSYANYPCPRPSRAAIRFTHDANGDEYYTKAQFQTTRRLYGEWNGCDSSVAAELNNPCVRYEGCRTPLIACAYVGIGHSIPASWASETWAFFSKFQ